MRYTSHIWGSYKPSWTIGTFPPPLGDVQYGIQTTPFATHCEDVRKHDESPLFLKHLLQTQEIYNEVVHCGEIRDISDGHANMPALGPSPVKWMLTIAQRYVVDKCLVTFPSQTALSITSAVPYNIGIMGPNFRPDTFRIFLVAINFRGAHAFTTNWL